MKSAQIVKEFVDDCRDSYTHAVQKRVDLEKIYNNSSGLLNQAIGHELATKKQLNRARSLLNEVDLCQGN